MARLKNQSRVQATQVRRGDRTGLFPAEGRCSICGERRGFCFTLWRTDAHGKDHYGTICVACQELVAELAAQARGHRYAGKREQEAG